MVEEGDEVVSHQRRVRCTEHGRKRGDSPIRSPVRQCRQDIGPALDRRNAPTSVSALATEHLTSRAQTACGKVHRDGTSVSMMPALCPNLRHTMSRLRNGVDPCLAKGPRALPSDEATMNGRRRQCPRRTELVPVVVSGRHQGIQSDRGARKFDHIPERAGAQLESSNHKTHPTR